MAIYYQSFCDKLQDVLCNYIKKEIFQLFKNKYLYKTRSIKRISKESIIKRRNLLKKILIIITHVFLIIYINGKILHKN